MAGTIVTGVGYNRLGGATTGSLSDNEFDLAGTTYTVGTLRIRFPASNNELHLEFDPATSGIANQLTLHIGSNAFPFADASATTAAGRTAFKWTSHGLSWSDNDSIAVKLTEPQAPSAPVNLRTKNKSATEITLKWAAPLKKGGLDITGYKIEESTDGITWTVLVADTMSSTTQYPLTGLTSGHMRHYRVSAINDVGTGPESNEAEGTAEDSAPEFSNAFVPSHNSSAVNVELDEDIDTTSIPDKSAFAVKVEGIDRTVTSVTAFGVDKGVTLGLASPVRPGEMVTVSYTKPGTNPLKDAAGNETASFTDRRVTNFLPPILPDAPTNLTAEGISTTQIDLSWSAPEYDGGSDVTGYKIEVSTDRGIMWTDLVEDTGTDDTEYSHTGLTAGAMRSYRVSAINDSEVERAVEHGHGDRRAGQLYRVQRRLDAEPHLDGKPDRGEYRTLAWFQFQPGSSQRQDVRPSRDGVCDRPCGDRRHYGVRLQPGTRCPRQYRRCGAACRREQVPPRGRVLDNQRPYLQIQQQRPRLGRRRRRLPGADGGPGHGPDEPDRVGHVGDRDRPRLGPAGQRDPHRLQDRGFDEQRRLLERPRRGHEFDRYDVQRLEPDDIVQPAHLPRLGHHRHHHGACVERGRGGAAPRPPGPPVVPSGHTELWSSALRVGTNGSNVGYFLIRARGELRTSEQPLVRVRSSHQQDQYHV